MFIFTTGLLTSGDLEQTVELHHTQIAKCNPKHISITVINGLTKQLLKLSGRSLRVRHNYCRSAKLPFCNSALGSSET